MKKNRGNRDRTDFKKNHQVRARRDDLTRRFHESDGSGLDDEINAERLSGKGDLTRRRTLNMGGHGEANPESLSDGFVYGNVLKVHGLNCRVRGDDGRDYMCAIRRVLKSVSTDQRHLLAAGDRVVVRIEQIETGMIESVEPRRGGVLSRTSKGRRHVLAANVERMLIVVSVKEPSLKPHLVDRFLLTAEQFQIRPVICFNKVDLIDTAELQPVVGVFAQIGYRTLLCSSVTGQGIDFLRALLVGGQTVITGQSGVGKTSLLNAVEPGLGLRVGEVSDSNQKGKHTTTTAEMIPLSQGGFVVDTPGIRQFQLWDIAANEVGSLMPDFRPYVSLCRYPNCLHLSENECAVKNAVADGRIDPRRYDGYCHLLEDDLAGEV